MSARETSLGLAELGAMLRTEIEAMRENLEGGDLDPLLYLDSAELTMTVSVEDAAETKSGFAFRVFGVGLDLGAAETEKLAAGNTLKLVLKTSGDVAVAVAGSKGG